MLNSYTRSNDINGHIREQFNNPRIGVDHRIRAILMQKGPAADAFIKELCQRVTDHPFDPFTCKVLHAVVGKMDAVSVECLNIDLLSVIEKSDEATVRESAYYYLAAISRVYQSKNLQKIYLAGEAFEKLCASESGQGELNALSELVVNIAPTCSSQEAYQFIRGLDKKIPVKPLQCMLAQCDEPELQKLVMSMIKYKKWDLLAELPTHALKKEEVNLIFDELTPDIDTEDFSRLNGVLSDIEAAAKHFDQDQVSYCLQRLLSMINRQLPSRDLDLYDWKNEDLWYPCRRRLICMTKLARVSSEEGIDLVYRFFLDEFTSDQVRPPMYQYLDEVVEMFTDEQGRALLSLFEINREHCDWVNYELMCMSKLLAIHLHTLEAVEFLRELIDRAFMQTPNPCSFRNNEIIHFILKRNDLPEPILQECYIRLCNSGEAYQRAQACNIVENMAWMLSDDQITYYTDELINVIYDPDKTVRAAAFSAFLPYVASMNSAQLKIALTRIFHVFNMDIRDVFHSGVKLIGAFIPHINQLQLSEVINRFDKILHSNLIGYHFASIRLLRVAACHSDDQNLCLIIDSLLSPLMRPKQETLHCLWETLILLAPKMTDNQKKRFIEPDSTSPLAKMTFDFLDIRKAQEVRNEPVPRVSNHFK